ncbi:hypothetical protein AK812_SmicGene18027 [Symbiodinium microadriaticum]|uniref:Major facilitator superfamily (MFS) profile domain-containing protein n=1 Tax=Symbiodinium microadriaticum TaxID=2951 RepID=A0A1Q9DWC7_SYMMI|nr:hypothetical protein AK812_SmicGene18027 [Symbiodinium microadriaticum]
MVGRQRFIRVLVVLCACVFQTSRGAVCGIPATATFLKPDVPFGDLDDSIRQGQRQGFAVNADSLTEVELNLHPINSSLTLRSDGVELVNLAEFLKDNGVYPETASVASHETRVAVGKAMLSFLEQRFGREIIHLADTSRVSGGAIYGEATVRHTGSSTLRNAHHVFHMDKLWDGVARLIGTSTKEGGVRATAHAHWPFSQQDFEDRGYSFDDYVRMVDAQDPGVLNLWVSLTPGMLNQHPIAFLLNGADGRNAISSAPDLNDMVSTMHVQIKNYNDTITVLRSSVASAETALWGVAPNMTFGQALLFYNDRTPHSAVWLTQEPEAERISAEIRVLVTDRPLQDAKILAGTADSECAGTADSECAVGAVSLLQKTATAPRSQMRPECLMVDVVIPAVVLTLLSTIVLHLVFRCVVDPAPVTYMLALGVYANFQDNLLFTVVLVRSHVIALQFQANPMASGCLVGAHKMGTAVGMVLVFLALKFYPECWRRPQRGLVAGALLQIVFSCTFALLAFFEVEGRLWVLWVMVASRLLLGMGGGLQVSLAWNLAARLPSEHRALHNLRLFVAGCLGLGAGPLVSSLATATAKFVPCGSDLNGSEGMLAFLALIPWMQLCLLLRPLPSLEQMADCRTAGGQSGARVAVVCLCLAMLVLRNLSLASLEVGTAELFQSKYDIEPGLAGLLCAIIVFTALPVQLLYERLQVSKQSNVSLRIMLWASLAAGWLLIFENLASFYIASMLFFPMMALSSGIVMARMQDYAMPDGSLLDRNTTTLLGLVMADFLGRGFGPISARHGIHMGEQLGFAFTQVTYAAVSVVLFVVSEVASLRTTQRKTETETDTSESSGDDSSSVASKGG